MRTFETLNLWFPAELHFFRVLRGGTLPFALSGIMTTFIFLIVLYAGKCDTCGRFVNFSCISSGQATFTIVQYNSEVVRGCNTDEVNILFPDHAMAYDLGIRAYFP